VRIRITVSREFTLGPESQYGTVAEYNDFSGDKEWMHAIFGDDLHDAIVQHDWQIKELSVGDSVPQIGGEPMHLLPEGPFCNLCWGKHWRADHATAKEGT
jgi:hypothetical protein